ncbi:MAG: hypothetical protein IJI22_03175 [Bacilli bacterium]|nr:hypothetical protein [Bacilli bacterium]
MLDEVKQLVEKLTLEINVAEKSLNNLQNSITTIQQGENNNPYWNGENAYGWLKSALAHFDHDAVLIDNLNECLVYLEKNKL